MATAYARAVSMVFGLRSALLLATASAALALGLSPSANAAPSCAVGTSGDDTCIITLGNIATESVDAGANTATGDKLQFTGGGLLSP
jgi:hypothetical protein